jgi:hypothetical protein
MFSTITLNDNDKTLDDSEPENILLHSRPVRLAFDLLSPKSIFIPLEISYAILGETVNTVEPRIVSLSGALENLACSGLF